MTHVLSCSFLPDPFLIPKCRRLPAARLMRPELCTRRQCPHSRHRNFARPTRKAAGNTTSRQDEGEEERSMFRGGAWEAEVAKRGGRAN